jgi:hypothetical protein
VRPLNFNTWNSLNETVAFDPSANYPDKTFGYAAGSVDAGKVVAGGAGGNWGGSMPRALWFARVADDWAKANRKSGSLVTSQKRSRQKTDSGNTSDHYEGNSDAYAVDIAAAGAEGDAILAYIMQKFGYPEYKGGSWFNITINGYRYQVGWRVKNHFDHIHVGVKRVVGGKDTSTGKKGTFGEKMASNSEVVAWFAKHASNVTLSGAFIDNLIKDDPEKPKKLEWFKKKFNVTDLGDPVKPKSSNDIVITAPDWWISMTKKVIDNFEGGYWNHWECKNHPYSAMYANSGETLFGLDRKAGQIEKICPAGKKFFAIIDGEKATLKDKFCEVWKYNYRGGKLEDELKLLAAETMWFSYNANMEAFSKHPETKNRIEKNKGLVLHMSYACWNGPGFFQKFVKALEKGVKEGKSDKQLIEIAKTTRAAALSGYWAKGSANVNKLIDKEAGLA